MKTDTVRINDAFSRLGTESAFEVLARARQLEEQGRPIINLGIGQPDFRTPDHIVEAAVKALRDGHHGYTPANGIRPLRETIARDLHRRHGATVDPDRIMVLPGGKVTMFFAILMFGSPGTEILYPNPGFPIYESVIRFTGATPVPVALHERDGFSFHAEEVLAAITPRTRLLIVNSPANPTGGVVPKEELDALVAGLARHPHVAIMSDEIYGEMLYDGRRHATLLAYPEIRDRLIVLDGFSKTYAMTGWRIGYSLWPEALFPHAERLAINCHSCTNAPTQYAAIAALDGPREPIDAMMRAFDERRRVIHDALNALPGVRCVMPGGAFYAFANIAGTGLGSKEMERRLLQEADVAALSGTSFGALGEGYVRFSYANSVENIRTAMARLGALLAA